MRKFLINVKKFELNFRNFHKFVIDFTTVV